MNTPTDEEISSMLVGIMSDGFNRSMNALEKAGGIDRSKMNIQYCGVGSKFYDLVTEQMVYTAKFGVPAMRQLFQETAQAPKSNAGNICCTMSMESERQEAYRQLLYTVLLHLRSGHRETVWWNPASWWQRASELRKLKELADCFHNLAHFSVLGFEGFVEERFWQDMERLGQTQGSKLVERYRRIFDEHVEGREAYVR